MSDGKGYDVRVVIRVSLGLFSLLAIFFYAVACRYRTCV